MSNWGHPSTLFVLTAGLCVNVVADAQAIDSQSLSAPKSEAALRSVWTVGRTVTFGAQSRRVQAVADLAFMVWNRAQCTEALRPSSPDDAKLLGTRPFPLPATTVAQKPVQNSEVAALQRSYRTLVRLGLYDEAAAIARRIAQPEDQMEGAGIVHAVAVERSLDPAIRPASFAGAAKNDWTTSGKKRVSCRFEGTSLEEVARFMAAETGCTVALPIGASSAPRVFLACKDLPADEVLTKIAESYGWVVQPTASGVALTPPLATPLRDARLPILR